MRVLIAGGGIVGLACGHELMRRGAGVIILDRGEFGDAASWGNAGWITPSFSTPLPAPGLIRSSLGMMLRPDSPLAIRPGLDLAFLRWLLTFTRHCNAAAYGRGTAALAAFNRRTFELFDDLERCADFAMDANGILFAFATAAGMRHVREDLEVMAGYGYPAPVLLTAAEARECEPAFTGPLEGALLAAAERHILPSSLTTALIRNLRAGGAALHPRTAVRRFHAERGRVRGVDTEAGPLDVDAVVLAAGAWSGRLARRAGFRLPVQAGRGYSIHISGPALRLSRPLYLTEARIAVSPFGGALRVAGTMELAGIDTRPDHRRIEGIRRGVSSFLTPRWEEGNAVREWAGLRPMLPDGLPAIGPAPHLQNLYVATGHGMLGVTLAPVTARAIADLILAGRTDIDLQPFDPGRFT